MFSFGPLFFLASIVVPLGVAAYLIFFAGAPVPTTSAVLSTVNNVVEVQGINDAALPARPRRSRCWSPATTCALPTWAAA